MPTDIILECGYCGRETAHDLERVLRGLTLEGVRGYLEPAPVVVRYACDVCRHQFTKEELLKKQFEGGEDDNP